MLEGIVTAKVGKLLVWMKNAECGQKYKKCLIKEIWEIELKNYFVPDCGESQIL